MRRRRVSLWNTVYRRRICGEHRQLPDLLGQPLHHLHCWKVFDIYQGCADAGPRVGPHVGNSAPMECNLVRYLSKHPECEVYCGQDAGRPGTGGADGGVLRRVEAAANAPPTASSAARPRRVALWHKLQKRKVVGNAAPLEKNVASCEPAPRRVQLARWPAGRAGRSAAAGRI